MQSGRLGAAIHTTWTSATTTKQNQIYHDPISEITPINPGELMCCRGSNRIEGLEENGGRKRGWLLKRVWACMLSS